jgi:hypothetical protein
LALLSRIERVFRPHNVSRRRNQVLLGGIALAILIGLFPPWHFVYDNRGYHISIPAGYAWSAPKCQDDQQCAYKLGSAAESVIDIERLALDWAILALLVWGILVVLKGQQDRKESEQKEP